MLTSHYCEKKREIALINSEDKSRSAEFRGEMAKAAQMWGELADRLLQYELSQNLFPGGIAKRA